MTKTCTKCGKELDLSYFGKAKRGRYGRRSECNICRREYAIKNKKHIKQYHDKYYIKNKETWKNSNYYNSNRDIIIKRVQNYYKLNRDSKIKYARKYHKLHPEYGRMSRRKRKALQFNVNENYTPQDEQYTYDLFNHMCANCGSKENLTIDHHYPLSKGNALTRTNAVLLCHSCNNNKRAKDPSTFYNRRIFKKITKLLAQSECKK